MKERDGDYARLKIRGASRRLSKENWYNSRNSLPWRKYDGSLTLKELFTRLRGSDKWLRGSISAYLEGKKGLSWLMGVIERSGLRGEELKREIEEMREGNEDKVEIILEECRKRGYIQKS